MQAVQNDSILPGTARDPASRATLSRRIAKHLLERIEEALQLQEDLETATTAMEKKEIHQKIRFNNRLILAWINLANRIIEEV